MGERKIAVYGVLSGGFSDDLPYGVQVPSSQTPMPPFRDMQNMIASQGALKNAWEWTALNATTYTKPTLDGNIASRQETSATNAQYVVGGAFISTSFEGQKAYVLITDGEIYVNGISRNPTIASGGTVGYTESSGTVVIGKSAVSTTNGSSLVARGVRTGDLFFSTAGASALVISQIRPLETQSSTSSTDHYVRRTFAKGTIPGKVTFDILNGDLYVACQGAGIDPGGTSGWCILKVADIFGSPQEATYVLSTWDVTGALSADSIVSGIDEIMGLKATADGRLVLSTNEDGIGNRVRWSSHRDLTKWANNEEAGFTDLATGPADIKCQCRIGETMVFYFADEIHVGIPTHDQIVPYSFQKTAASIGTRWYRGACEARYGNLFVGSDGHFYVFDGNRTTKLTDETIRKYTKGPDQVYLTGDTAVADVGTVTFSGVSGTVTVA